MLIRKGYRFRLDLSEGQAVLCSRTAGTCRWLWNLALEQRGMAWRHGQHSIGFAAQCSELPSLKAAAPWVGEAPSPKFIRMPNENPRPIRVSGDFRFPVLSTLSDSHSDQFKGPGLEQGGPGGAGADRPLLAHTDPFQAERGQALQEAAE